MRLHLASVWALMHNLLMRRIVFAIAEDKPRIEKTLGRAINDNEYEQMKEPSLDCFSSRLDSMIEARQLLVEKENGIIVGAIEYIHDDGKLLLGENATQRQIYDLLDQIDFKGEATIVIRTIFVDPTAIGKGAAKELISTLFAQNKETSFLLQVNRRNTRAISFFKKNGFYEIPYPIANPDNLFMAKPYVPQGLCRNAFW